MILKALSNETRYTIMELLKDVETNFPAAPEMHKELIERDFRGGVCVGSIQEKVGLAQSVVSGYLNTLQRAGLLESKRIGQWTYYRRNEKQIQAFTSMLKHTL